MSDSRTIIIGMNNPYGQRPEMALYPAPERCAGWNLWKMLNEVGKSRGLDILRMHYVKAFDRRNVLSADRWSKADARRAAQDLLPTLAGRRVIVLGAETADVLGLPRTDIGVWAEAHVMTEQPVLGSTYAEIVNEVVQDKLQYTWLPHPSGRNLNYNDNDVRWRAGAVLLKEFLTSDVGIELVYRPPAG